MGEYIAVLDCGSQYTKVIDRKIRELEVRSEIFRADVSAEEIRGAGGIILTGGPENGKAVHCDPGIFGLGVPVLGICHGMNLIFDNLGGEISECGNSEVGEAVIEADPDCPLFNGLDKRQQVLLSPTCSVKNLPEGFRTAASAGETHAAVYNMGKRFYGLQFYPEVDLTVNGKKMFENFLRVVCGLQERYSIGDRIGMSVDAIRKQVGDADVMVLVSGGVDSAVTAALLLRALPAEKVHAIHIDHGFMRKNESEAVCEGLRKLGLKNLLHLQAKDKFYNGTAETDAGLIGPLNTICDPEQKRAIIGQVFFDLSLEAARELKMDFDTSYLAQGTLRPDLIESGNPDVSSYAKKIKTHHNDVDIIRKYRDMGRIVETNADWHKDEVRQVARILGLPEEIASRQPFPGPGLSVRLLCAEGDMVTDAGIEERLKKLAEGSGFEARLLPVRSVGVAGDNRSYGCLAMIRPMGVRDWDALYKFSKAVTNGIPEINRVCLCLTDEAFGDDICQFPCHVGDETAGLLRELDHMTTTALAPFKAISQAFAVLLPIGGGDRRFSCAIRSFVTTDFMTGRPATTEELPLETLFALRDRMTARFPELKLVVYDVTSKPPATCEWE